MLNKGLRLQLFTFCLRFFGCLLIVLFVYYLCINLFVCLFVCLMFSLSISLVPVSHCFTADTLCEVLSADTPYHQLAHCTSLAVI